MLEDHIGMMCKYSWTFTLFKVHLPYVTLISDKETQFGLTVCVIIYKKGKKKSRECHYHKPQPFSDTKR